MKNLFSSTVQGLSEVFDLRLLASTVFALIVLLAAVRSLAQAEEFTPVHQVSKSARP